MTDETDINDFWYGAPKAGEELEFILEGAERFKGSIDQILTEFGGVIERTMREVKTRSAITVLYRQLIKYTETRRIYAPVKEYVFDKQLQQVRELDLLISAYEFVIDDLKKTVDPDDE
jgi:hypothetical protein